MNKIAHKIEEKERTNDVKLKDQIPFQKMVLKDPVKKGIEQSGFVYPTIIQANAIPLGKTGIDLLVQSKSGTGKTLIFCTILLESYDVEIREPQSLILVPTREIAVQIENILNKIGKFLQGFKAVSVIGGLEVTDDRKKIQGAKAIVGTPGRVLHLIQNDMLNTSKMKLLVLDEADKMMSQTFRIDFEKINTALPRKKQFVCCSATYSNDLDTKLANFMKNPIFVSTEKRATLLIGIKQYVIQIPEEKTSILEMQSKIEALQKVLSKIMFKQCLVFASSQSRAQSYRNALNKCNWPCEVISAAQDQKTRLEIFKKFQEFQTKILISTDLMSRGIDSENVNLVVNLELPEDETIYLHRIGRSGRFGSHGIAVTFCASEKDNIKFKRILEKIGSGMNVLKFPKSEDYANNSIDLWDFSNLVKEISILGTFNDISPNENDQKGKHTLDMESNKENLNEHNIVNRKQIMDNENIDSKTYKIECERDSNANKLLLTETMSSLNRLPSSNTIDDASSIAVDSDILLRSNGLTLCSKEIRKPSPSMSFLEVLIDESKSSSSADNVDLFEDYKNAKSCVKPINAKSDWKDLLLDSNSKKLSSKLKDVFVDYEKAQTTVNGISTSLEDDNSQQTHNSQIPSTSTAHIKLLNVPINDSQSQMTLEQKQHYPSPNLIRSPLVVQQEIPPAHQDNRQDSGSSSTNGSSSVFRETSSGFDERTTCDTETSGIRTSSSDSDGSGSEGNGTDQEYESSSSSENKTTDYMYTSDDDEEIVNSINYSESSDDDDRTLDEFITKKEIDSLTNDPNVLYQNAYARWTDLYWNQLTHIQDYAKFYSYVRKNQL